MPVGVEELPVGEKLDKLPDGMLVKVLVIVVGVFEDVEDVPSPFC